MSDTNTLEAHAGTNTSGHDQPLMSPGVSWCLIVGLGLAIWLAAAWHVGQLEVGWEWRLLAIFFPTILSLMLRPMPGGALVLMGLLLCVMVGALTIKEALAGYADKSVWLVLAAYFLARAFLKTGLARRIALTFVRVMGRRTLGLSYALVASDTLLAGMIPSNAARVGGVVLPITRSLAELFKSTPGKSAGLLGTYLMLVLYQGDVVACALFLTGQASNPMAANQAATLTGGKIVLGYGTWLWYALAPALVSLLLVPWVVYRLQTPEITETPEATEFAREELARLGRPSRDELVLGCVFVLVCTLWIALGAAQTSVVALGGAAVLLLTGVLTWEDCISERGAWDVFIWYGGLVQLGSMLDEAGLPKLFAENVVSQLGPLHWFALFLVLMLIYFYAHYAFASITTHLIAMYPAFVAVLLVAGAPMGLVAVSFAFFANLAAGLTHYGTTPAPIIFGHGYVSQGTWWRVGFLLSLLNISVWLIVGLAWWKLLGLW